MKKNVFLFMCHVICAETMEEYRKIVKATKDIGDCCLLYHLKENKQPSELNEYVTYVFTNESLSGLNYPRVGKSVVPGNCHFPLLQYFLDHPEYDFYWLIEYDVRFSGDWRLFFKSFHHDDEDLLTCLIRKYSDNPKWSWWQLEHPTKEIPLLKRYASFNPIYRISKPALQLIDKMQKEGWQGHNEVLLPTLLYHNGLRLRDFGGNGQFVKTGDENRFYLCNSDKSTVRWRPRFKKIGKNDGKLYHPVKPKKG